MGPLPLPRTAGLRTALVLGLSLATLGLGAGACAEAEPDAPAAELPPPDTVDAEAPVVQHHERLLAFMTPAGDSTLSLHWSWDSRVRPGGVSREIQGFLARNGTWERFLNLDWVTRPDRSPWRIQPRRPVRLVMGDGDGLERIVYAEGGRDLQLVPGSTLAEWTGQGGETVRLQEAEMFLASRAIDGLLLDLSRAGDPAGAPPGDWAVLSAGNALQFVLEDPGSTEAPSLFRGWARLDFRLLQWPEIVVTWTEQRPFESARRDIPLSWSLASLDGEITGEIQAAASHLEAVDGPGPLLPVRALFEVEGTLRIEGREFPVRGVWRHLQP